MFRTGGKANFSIFKYQNWVQKIHVDSNTSSFASQWNIWFSDHIGQISPISTENRITISHAYSCIM